MTTTPPSAEYPALASTRLRKPSGLAKWMTGACRRGGALITLHTYTQTPPPPDTGIANAPHQPFAEAPARPKSKMLPPPSRRNRKLDHTFDARLGHSSADHPCQPPNQGPPRP